MDVVSQKERTKIAENRQAEILQITLGETSEFKAEMEKDVFIVETDSRRHFAELGIKLFMDVLIDNSRNNCRKRFDLKDADAKCKKGEHDTNFAVPKREFV